MCGGCLISSCSSDPTNGGHDEADSDDQSHPTANHDVVYGGGTPHVNVALSGRSTEQRGPPAERVVSCPSERRAESAGPSPPAPDFQNKAHRASSLSERARRG